MKSGRISAIRGNIIFTKSAEQFTSVPRGFLVFEDGRVLDVFESLPECYENIETTDFGDRMIVPGLVDLHVHAPQYAYRGLGMDLELLPWLEEYAFKEEAKYRDEAYARAAYGVFCAALKRSATTHASVFATLHAPATEILMDLLEETGLVTFVGKVNMDRNSPEDLTEAPDRAASDTEAWLKRVLDRYVRTKPILTPRFVPTCSDKLMTALGGLAAEYGVPVQSHLSENKNEIDWVRRLHPDCPDYAGVYEKYGLFGKGVPTVMAHCVYPTDRELALIARNGVVIAHCPSSNTNISSGIAPVRRMLDSALRVGLGSDVAGGFSLSIFRAMTDAVQVSKLYSVLVDPGKKALTLPEAFCLATKGGGSFFGKVGSFEPGYVMSAVVIDDAPLGRAAELTPEQRLERIAYLSTDEMIVAKYAGGARIF